MRNAALKPSRVVSWTLTTLALVVLAAWFFVWRAGAETMRRSIDAWAEDQRAAGFSVVYNDVRTTGFPFFLRGALENAAISDGRNWRWSAATLNIDTLPYALDRLTFSAANPQTLDLGAHGLWSLATERGRVSIESDKARDWTFTAESGPGVLSRADGGAALSAEKFLLSIAPAATDLRRIEASLIVDKFALVRAGETIDAPHIEAFVETEERAARGREISLKHVSIEAEGARLLLQGKLGVDANGFPEGVLQAEITDPAGLAALLGKTGALSPGEADQAAAALTLAAIAGGGKLKGPIELKNGAARIAGVKIADLPKLD